MDSNPGIVSNSKIPCGFGKPLKMTIINASVHPAVMDSWQCIQDHVIPATNATLHSNTMSWFGAQYNRRSSVPREPSLGTFKKGYGKVELVIFCETTFYKQHNMTI